MWDLNDRNQIENRYNGSLSTVGPFTSSFYFQIMVLNRVGTKKNQYGVILQDYNISSSLMTSMPLHQVSIFLLN